MGKRVTVRPDFTSVRLPPSNTPYKAGDTVDLTDAQYASLQPADLRALTVVTTIPDPGSSTTPTVSGLDPSKNLSDLADGSAARNNLGLGSAATSDSTAFASAAQGSKADTAVQPAQVWTRSASDARYASAAQGSKADTAVQPASVYDRQTSDSRYATSMQGSKADTAVQPTQVYDKTTSDSRYATAAQGAEADTAVQPSQIYDRATSDSRYASAAQGSKADTAVQPASVYDRATSDGRYATVTQGGKADTAVQPSSVYDKTTSDGRYAKAFFSVVTKTASYTLTQSDDVVLANTNTTGFTITLPSAVVMAGKRFRIKKTSTDTNTLSIVPQSGQTIENGSSLLINATNRPSYDILSDGSNWWLI